MRRIICEEEPPRPSTRLITGGEETVVSTRRPGDPKKLLSLVRGELDWIVMRALDKDRNRRYETADAFAADVRHYLNDEPVSACPPSAWYRTRKFARRHRGALATAAVLALAFTLTVAGVAGSIGWAARDKAAREKALDQTVERDLSAAADCLGRGQWAEAADALERADKLLKVAGRQEQPPLLEQLRADLALALRLEEIYSRPKHHELFNRGALDAEYDRAFRDADLDLAELAPPDAAARIRASAIRLQLVRALDIWSGMRREAQTKGPPHWKALLELARAADPDDWRDRLRDALAQEDRKSLEALAVQAPVRELPPGTLHLLAIALRDLGAPAQAAALLRQAQLQYPDDLWLNDELGWLSWSVFKNYDDTVRYYTAVQVLRPRSPIISFIVGQALYHKGCYEEAAAQFTKALELKPDNGGIYWWRGLTYEKLQQPERAGPDFEKARRLDPALRKRLRP
jgi:tetratricopeptide (TPR) repeat protein